ncbi:MAG: DNA mismatch repair endonuclease MutL [Fusobacterium sp.]|nr:DNA mismatch repair endonuclease MutL [Fusobacterium sp.]
MGRIKILDESVSNAIAAGEVVENPTSMIKELIENSLDAGSKSIKLEIKNGGLNVSISDDGQGMSREDLLLCVERHATSKISTKEDLFKIRTYGFRGEALSSIASVSKMIMCSRTAEMESGTQINILGGKITNLKDVQKNVGTYIEIKDLFYNTPARKKFLRKDTTEYLNIKDVIIREALTNPHVKFLLFIDGKESITTSGNGMENTILEIFGKNYLKNSEKFSLGYLGNANLFKSNKESIYVFVNNRPVKSKIIETAVIDAYHTKLMKGKYPSALIFIDIDPERIDVNVHPSKKIVKFDNQRDIYNLVKGEIDNVFADDEEFCSASLDKNLNNEDEDLAREHAPLSKMNSNNFLDINNFKKDLQEENKKIENLSQLSAINREEYSMPIVDNFFENKLEKKIEENSNNNFSEFRNSFEIRENSAREHAPLSSNAGAQEKIEEKKYIFEEEDTKRNKIFESFENLKNINFKVIGQIFDTFILVERNGIFEIYDQHIIHERILYEKLKQEYSTKAMSKQNLLVPIRMELNPLEKQLVLDNLEIFSDFAYEIDDFDKNEILLRSTPVMNLRASNESIIREIIDNILKNKDTDIRENILVSMSCKGAIKANHKLTMEEMYSMVAKLHEVGKYTCPHGRPIIVKLSQTDLEKLFKRK